MSKEGARILGVDQARRHKASVANDMQHALKKEHYVRVSL